MKVNGLLLFVLSLLTSCYSGNAAQLSTKVPDQLWEKVHREGMVRVIVSLNVPVQPEAGLNQDAINSQRHRIAEAQKELIKELAGTKHTFIGGTITLPSAGFSVGADALAILEKSSMVRDVSESKYTPPQKYELRENKP